MLPPVAPVDPDMSDNSKPSRSDFIEKLHDLLEHPQHPKSLRWLTDDTFEISANEAKAIAALSPKWEFRSLSSFIRQLSYYSFQRLSDRRRAKERRVAGEGFISFGHQSGCFTRGDDSNLDKITRTPRATRPSSRRGSAISNGSSEGDWPMSSFAQVYPPELRSMLAPHCGTMPVFHSPFAQSSSSSSSRNEVITWKEYIPGGSSGAKWTAPRRSSVPDFKLSPAFSICRPTPLMAPIESSPTLRPPPFSTHAPKPLRKAAAGLSINLPNSNYFDGGLTSPRESYPSPTSSPNYSHTTFPSSRHLLSPPASSDAHSSQPQLSPTGMTGATSLQNLHRDWTPPSPIPSHSPVQSHFAQDQPERPRYRHSISGPATSNYYTESLANPPAWRELLY